MLGDSGCGKTALVSQFMTSEYMHTYDASLGKSSQSCHIKMECIALFPMILMKHFIGIYYLNHILMLSHLLYYGFLFCIFIFIKKKTK